MRIKMINIRRALRKLSRQSKHLESGRYYENTLKINLKMSCLIDRTLNNFISNLTQILIIITSDSFLLI